MKRRTFLAGATTLVTGCAGSQLLTVRDDTTSTNLNTKIKTSPRTVDETVIVGTEDGLVGIAPDLSERRWTIGLDGELFGRPAVENKTVFVTTVVDDEGSERSRLVRVDADAAEVVWRTDLAPGVAYAPTVTGSSIIVRTLHGVRSVSKDGELLWSDDQFPDAGGWGPYRGDQIRVVVDGERLYVTSPTAVTAVDRETREVRWEVPANDPLAPPTIADGTAYVPAGAEGLRAVDVDSGSERWRLSAETVDGVEIGGAFGTPLLADGRIFTSLGAHFLSVEETGDVEWRTKSLRGNVYTNPLWKSGSIYSTGGIMFTKVDPDRGDVRTLSNEWDTKFSPVASDTAVYCAAVTKLYRHPL